MRNLKVLTKVLAALLLVLVCLSLQPGSAVATDFSFPALEMGPIQCSACPGGLQGNPQCIADEQCSCIPAGTLTTCRTCNTCN